MKHIVYGESPEKKDEAMRWLKSIADDKNNTNSTYATIIKKILDYYEEKSGALQ